MPQRAGTEGDVAEPELGQRGVVIPWSSIGRPALETHQTVGQAGFGDAPGAPDSGAAAGEPRSSPSAKAAGRASQAGALKGPSGV